MRARVQMHPRAFVCMCTVSFQICFIFLQALKRHWVDLSLTVKHHVFAVYAKYFTAVTHLYNWCNRHPQILNLNVKLKSFHNQNASVCAWRKKKANYKLSSVRCFLFSMIYSALVQHCDISSLHFSQITCQSNCAAKASSLFEFLWVVIFCLFSHGGYHYPVIFLLHHITCVKRFSPETA